MTSRLGPLRSARRTLRPSSTLTLSRDPLLALLLRNKELSAEEAENELRWIRTEARENVQRQAAEMFAGDMPSMGDVEAMRGLEEGAVMGLVERRAMGEPLQYILGTVDFGSLTIRCRPPTLIPRPETAHIFGELADRLFDTRQGSPLTILDLCTGTGCVPLLLSQRLGSCLERAIGIDISPQAISLAEENARILEISNTTFYQSDLFSNTFVPGVLDRAGRKVSIITANPPYISRKEWERLPPSVKKYEDPRALLGDPTDSEEGQGLSFYQRIAEIIPELLISESEMEDAGWAGTPRIVLEVGYGQADAVSAILKGAGLARIEVWPDQYGVQRAVVGYTSRSAN